MLHIKFQVDWPFGSAGEAKNRFSRWLPWRPSLISDWNDFSYFWSTSHPNASYQVSSQLAFRFRRRNEKQMFKMATMAAILDFQMERFKLFFYLKVTPILPTKFQVKWPFRSGEEAKNTFPRWPPSSQSVQRFRRSC